MPRSKVGKTSPARVNDRKWEYLTIGSDTMDDILRAICGDDALLLELREQQNIPGSPIHTILEKHKQRKAQLSAKAATIGKELTAEQFRALFSYDPETGIVTKKVMANDGQIKNVPVGAKANGYIRVLVGHKLYSAHRLAFLYMTGKWPSKVIDHINGDRSDNRFANLRDVDQYTNVQNHSYSHVQNPHEFPGVKSHPSNGSFCARIQYRHKQIHLGWFNTAEEAHQAYAEAKNNLRNGIEPTKF